MKCTLSCPGWQVCVFGAQLKTGGVFGISWHLFWMLNSEGEGCLFPRAGRPCSPLCPSSTLHHPSPWLWAWGDYQTLFLSLWDFSHISQGWQKVGNRLGDTPLSWPVSDQTRPLGMGREGVSLQNGHFCALGTRDFLLETFFNLALGKTLHEQI